MPWKQCIIPIGDECYERIRDGVEVLALRARDAPDLALFTRTTADRRRRVLLLSPLAVELAGDALSARWTECEAPELFEWDVVVGQTNACETLGLRRPRFWRRAEPSPVAEIGRDPRGSSPDGASPQPSGGPGSA